MARRGVTVRDDSLHAWLARALHSGRLVGLPPYGPPSGGPRQRPEKYARRLLGILRPPGAGGTAHLDAAAFRDWVESQPRPHVGSARSHIDLQRHTFASLRTLDEIHQALESIALPDPKGRAFEVTSPLPPEVRAELRRRRKAARAARLARRADEWGPMAAFVLLMLTLMTLLAAESATSPGARDFWGFATALLSIATLLTLGHAIRGVRRRSAASRKVAAGRLHDRWIDDPTI
jgi:hypothetical protein